MAKGSGKLAKKPAKKAVGKKLSAKKPAKKRSGLPLPAGVPAKAKKPPQAVLKAEARHLEPLDVKPNGGDAAVLDRLWETVEARRASGDVEHSHSARLMARGTAKVAQKLGEEAVECVIERSEEHTSELQSRQYLVCRLLLEKKNRK